MNLSYEDQRRYIHYFGEAPRSRKIQREMNARIDEIEREEYENRQEREREQMETMFRHRFGRLPINNAEVDAFLEQMQAEEQAEIDALHREQEQINKLKQLHTYHPNLNMTMAEELQRYLGHPVSLKRYVRKQKKKGVPLEQALDNYAQGGPSVEGVGKGPVRNVYPNTRKVVKKQNAQEMGLIPDPKYKNTPLPADNKYNNSASNVSGTRRRKRRGGRRARTVKK